MLITLFVQFLVQDLLHARDDEGRTDNLLSLLLPVHVAAAVKSSDADSLCSAEHFKVSYSSPLPPGAGNSS